MRIEALRNRIEKNTVQLGVVGLGYVGLPAAALFAQARLQVVGVDVNEERVNTINAGQCPIQGNEPGLAELLGQVVSTGSLKATTDYAALASADVVLLVVDTPVEQDTHLPRYEALRAACHSLGGVMKPGALVIVESTVSPGTVHHVVRPILEQVSGMKLNIDFFLGACPERVMPGRLLANLRTVSRVCGGSTPQVASTMVSLYALIVQAALDETDIITAELVKTAENAYRDVQIAFANEVALVCEATGANIWRVRELVNKSPGRQMHLPGAGVGGHCIPKDPWLLAAAVEGKIQPRLIPTARAINDSMPLHVADLLVRALKEANRLTRDTKVAILGFAYLEDSDDTRNSPSARLASRLESLGIDYVIHDPWVPAYQGDVLDCVAGCDAVVIMVRHAAYRQIDLKLLKSALRTPILVDGRNVFGPSEAEAEGFAIYAIGRGDIYSNVGQAQVAT